MRAAELAVGMTGHSRVILDRLLAAKDRDYEQPIGVLYRAAFGVADADVPPPRLQMQRLGTYVKRLNAKLAPDWHIGPGEARRTYRLKRREDGAESTLSAG